MGAGSVRDDLGPCRPASIGQIPGFAEMQRIGNSAIKEIQQQLNVVANKMTKQSAKVVKLFTDDKFVCGKDVKYTLAQLGKLGLKADLN